MTAPTPAGGTSPREKPIITITQARSGSNLLAGYLAQVPRVIAFTEILRRVKPVSVRRIARVIPDGEDVVSSLEEIQRRDPAAFWDALQEALAGHGYRPAAKIFYSHNVKNAALWGKFENAKILHLIRENVLAAVVSKRLARRSGQYQTKAYDHDYDSAPIQVSDKECELHLQGLRAKVQRTRERFGACDYTEITYDTIVNVDNAEAALTKALGQPVSLKRAGRQQQRRRPLSEVVANYQVVARFDGNADLRAGN